MSRSASSRLVTSCVFVVAVATPSVLARDDSRYEPGPRSSPPAQPCAASGDPLAGEDASGADSVDLWSGEYTKSVVDLRIKGRGVDFVWVRKYRSQAGPTTAMGVNWDYSYDVRVTASGNDLVVYDGNSRRDTYYQQADGSWARDEFFRRVTRNANDGTYTLTFPDSSTWSFRPLDRGEQRGKIDHLADKNGNTLSFEYDTKGRLAAVRDTLNVPALDNRVVRFTYDSAGHVTSLTDFAGRVVKYTYYKDGDANGSAGDLATVTTPAVTGTPTGNDFPNGRTTNYTYSTGSSNASLNHNLLTIVDGNGNTIVSNSYATTKTPSNPNFDHLTAQTRGGPNDRLQFVYDSQTPSSSNNGASERTIVNDRVGNVHEYYYDSRNRLVMKRDYTGRAKNDEATTETKNRPTGKLRSTDPDYYETRYSYNADSMLTQVVRPDGTTTNYAYDYDLDSTTPRRSRGDLREIHQLPGSKPSDQPELVTRYQYDDGASGTNQLTKVTDPRGFVTQYSYDAHGNRTETDAPIGSIVTKYEYNSFGQLTRALHPDNGSGVHRDDRFHYYDTNDGAQNGYRKDEVDDSANLGLTTRYTYDAVGNTTSVVDPRGHTTSYTYNQLDELVRETSRQDVNGVRYTYDAIYDADGHVTERSVLNVDDHGVVQPNSRLSTIYTYDSQSRTLLQIGEVDASHSATTEYQYDGNGNRTLIREGEATNGHDPFDVTRTLYDERDLPYQTTRGDGSPLHSTTQYDYDGNRNRVTTSEGLESTPHVTTTTYDGYDRVSSRTDAMGNVTQTHYDEDGNVVSTRTDGELVDVPGSANDVRLVETHSQYDEVGRVIRVDELWFDPVTGLPIDDGARTTRYDYNDESRQTERIDDLGRTTTTTYDSDGRVLTQTDPRGNTTTYHYDEDGDVVTQYDLDYSDVGDPAQLRTTTSTYDELGRVTSQTDPMGRTTQSFYDSRGDVTLQIDPLGVQTRTYYDGLGRPIERTQDMDGDGASDLDSDDVTTRTAYDDSSRVVSTTDANGHVTQYGYDSLDRRVSTTQPDGTSVSYGYDVHGDRVSKTDANGTTTHSTYDALDRLTSETVVPGAGVSNDTTFRQFVYDGRSRVVQASDDDSRTSFVYDSLGDATSASSQLLPSGPTRTTSYVYDGVGEKLTIVDPGGRTIQYTYDSLGRRDSVTDAATHAVIATYDYFGPSAHALEARHTADGVATSYDTNADDQIVSTSADGPLGPLDHRSYGYDADGQWTTNVETTVVPNRTTTYGYDANHRLTTADVQPGGPTVQYHYDHTGNRTTVVGGPHAGGYTMDPTTPEPADAQENQYTTTPFDARGYDRDGNLTSTTTTSFTYDGYDRLVRVVPSGGPTTTYRYDALGRRLESSVGGVVTRFYYDDRNVVEEQNGSNQTTNTYVHGANDELVQEVRGATTYYDHSDARGSAVMLTDSTGHAVERYRYDEFGTPTFYDGNYNPIPSSSTGNPYLYDGMRYDAESGLYDDVLFTESKYDSQVGRPTTRATSWWGRDSWYDDEPEVVVESIPPDFEEARYPFDPGDPGDRHRRRSGYPDHVLEEIGPEAPLQACPYGPEGPPLLPDEDEKPQIHIRIDIRIVVPPNGGPPVVYEHREISIVLPRAKPSLLDRLRQWLSGLRLSSLAPSRPPPLLVLPPGNNFCHPNCSHEGACR